MYYAKDYRAMARKSLKGHWPMSVLVAFLAMILGGLQNQSIFELNIEPGNTYITLFGLNIGQNTGLSFGSSISEFTSGFFHSNLAAIVGAIAGVSIIYGLVIFIIGGAIELGIRNYFLKLNYDMNPEVGELFSRMKIFGRALGLRIVMAIFIILWSLLFIIPGIIAAYRYSMATYLMAENPDMGILEAIDKSKEMMIGNKWRLFCLDISFIGWHILCALTAGLGYLLLHPYMESARAHFYLTLKHGMSQ